MNTSQTILTAPEATVSDRMLQLFQEYQDNIELTLTDLFAFLTTPTAEREEFFALYCHKDYSSNDQIIIQHITAK